MSAFGTKQTSLRVNRNVSFVVLAATFVSVLHGTPTSAASALTLSRPVLSAASSGGSGTLVFHGRRYPISIGGVSYGFTFGAAQIDTVGWIFVAFAIAITVIAAVVAYHGSGTMIANTPVRYVAGSPG